MHKRILLLYIKAKFLYKETLFKTGEPGRLSFKVSENVRGDVHDVFVEVVVKILCALPMDHV